MSLQHFFLDTQIISDSIEASTSVDASFLLNLSKEDLKHVQVLRLRPGEHIGVVDAASVYYECEIIDISQDVVVKNCCHDKLESNLASNCPASKITLCFGLAKGNKLDDVVRACTEIGIDEFWPVEFSRCVVKLDKPKAQKRQERWKKIAKSAAMQSGQYRIPTVGDVFKFKDFVGCLQNFDAVYVCWEEALNKLEVDAQMKNIAVVVGPEGGISAEEIDEMKTANNNTHIVSIGNSILRTETANIVASALVKFSLFE